MSKRSHIVASARDNVATAVIDLEPGDGLDGGQRVTERVRAGHKVALQVIDVGMPVIKLGQPIGIATRTIEAGEHVHTHNLGFAGKADRTEIGVDLQMPAPADYEFNGYVRADGQVGTRNFIGILTSVNCSATVARRIAAHFTADRLAAYPGIDGVVAFSHMSGCGMAKSGRGMDNLRRTIAGYANHPNFAAVLLVGLGCEVNQIDTLLASAGLQSTERLQTLGIQATGGTRAAIAAGITVVEDMLDTANAAKRVPVSVAHLTLGLQCGASDGYSALTANPALGIAADLIVAAGGKVILSETPEVFGAENLLLHRAVTTQVAKDLIARLDWWEQYAQSSGADLDNNPSPGNIAGGITTILEKSLGAVAKSGSTPLNAVVDYAARVTTGGLNFMDTPGYDPCSATGQIAGGANLIAFTTGRGSVFGSKPAPTLKLSSNSALAQTMADDIDFDCGRLLSENVCLDDLGRELFEMLLATASGRSTASECMDLGENEFVPWMLGPVF